MEKDAAFWDKLRANAISPDSPPEWPAGVSSISLSGLGLVGVDRRSRELFWDGQKLVTEKRFSNFERGLAIVGLLIAAIGVAGTVVQAYAAVLALPIQ